MGYFVGLDWAQQEHAVWVLDERGGTVGSHGRAHCGRVAELAERLGRSRRRRRCVVAIGDRPALLVDTLSSAGSPSWAIPPTPSASRPHY